MRPSIQNMRKLLNRRTMTLFAVCLLLLAAVAANVIMNRNEEKAAKAATAAVSVPAPGAQGSFFDMYRSERDSVRTQELAYLDAIVAQGGDEATLSEAQKQKMTLVDCMESELNTENLIRAKGFEEVIVSMHNGSVNVIVDADALTDEQVAQILDIVLRQTGETAENIKVSTAQKRVAFFVRSWYTIDVSKCPKHKEVNTMNEVDTNIENIQGGKIVFAEDVVATIAFLAASEVEGVHAMIGTTMEGLSEKLGKKNYTKGVKVEVGTEECACDITIVVKYGYRIQEVAQKVQQEIKNAIETMTGLKVVEVNVNVNGIYFEPEKKEEPAPAPEPEPVAEEPEAPAPRVK